MRQGRPKSHLVPWPDQAYQTLERPRSAPPSGPGLRLRAPVGTGAEESSKQPFGAVARCRGSGSPATCLEGRKLVQRTPVMDVLAEAPARDHIPEQAPPINQHHADAVRLACVTPRGEDRSRPTTRAPICPNIRSGRCRLVSRRPRSAASARSAPASFRCAVHGSDP